MMPRNPRRSSILKEPKQVTKSPRQNQDCEDEGTIVQMTSGRVSFSRASQVKEFDSSFDDKTKWNQSTDDSLESIEGDENQSRSANVFEDPSSVQTQKKSKRKRMPTVQPLLNSSGIATSNLNQLVQQSPNTRVLKQPRKSLDCSKATFFEEGDTQMFFDDLNLTEPIMCSYSNMDASLNISRTLIDSVLDYSCVNLGKKKNNSPPGVLSESTSESILKDDSVGLDCTDEGVLDKTELNEDPNRLSTEAIIHGDLSDECESLSMSVDGVNVEYTLPGENVHFPLTTYSNEDGSKDQNCSISREIISSTSRPIDDDVVKDKTLCNTSASVVGDSDHDDLLPVTPMPEKTVLSWASEDPLDETTSLDASMDLTIPPVIRESTLSKVEHQEGSNKVSLGEQDLEATELEVTGTWGQIAEKINSLSPLICKTDIVVVGDKSETFTSENYATDEFADCTVNSNLELSMRSGGLVCQENLDKECLNTTQGSDFTDEMCEDIEDKELAVPSREITMSKVGDDLKDDCLQPSETFEVMLSDPNISAAGSNLEEGFPKALNERSFTEETVNYTNYSDGLDETCADVHGMDLTVPLGKIRVKMQKSTIEKAMPHGGDQNHSSPGKLIKTELVVDDFLEEGKKTEEETNSKCQPADSGLLNPEVPSDGESQTLKQTEFEAVGAPSILVQHQSYDELYDQPTSPKSAEMDATLPLQDLKEDEYRDAEDNTESKSLVIDSNHPDAQKMELTILAERIKRESCESPLKPISQSQLMDDSNLGTMCMDMTVPLGRFKGETHKCPSDNMLSETQTLNETKHDGEDTNNSLPESQTMDYSGTMSMDFTVPLGRIKGETQEFLVKDMLSESQIVNETKSEALEMSNMPPESQIMDETTPEMVGMELTVPLGRFNEERHEHTVDNVLSESHIMDGTTLEKMGMELDVSVKGIKKDFYVDNEMVEETLFNTVNESPFLTDGNLKLVEVESSAPLAEEESVNLTTTLIEDCKDIDDTKGHSVSQSGEVVGSNGEGPVTQSLSGVEVMDDTIPELLAVEFSVVDVVHPDSSVTQFLMMDDTISDTMGMEMTPHQGKVRQRKSQDTDTADASKQLYATEINPKVEGVQFAAPLVTSVVQNSPSSYVKDKEAPKAECETSISEIGDKSEFETADSVQIMDGTTPEKMCMELDVSNEGTKKDVFANGQNVEETFIDTVNESQILADGNLAEVESSAPLAKEETVNLTTTVIEVYEDIEDTKGHFVSLEMTSQSAEVVGSNEEEQVTESVTEIKVNESVEGMEVMDDAVCEPLAVESVEVGVVDVTHPDSSVAESLLMDSIISDRMGLEMTPPLEELMGMELTPPQGKIKQRKSQDTDTADASKQLYATEINPKVEDVQFAAPLVNSVVQNSPSSSVKDKESPKAECETSISELGEKSELETTDTVSEAENSQEPADTNDVNSLEKQFCVPSERQEGGNIVHDDDGTSKPISEDGRDVQGIEVESISSLSVPNEEQNRGSSDNELLDCNAEVETDLRDVQAESSISLEVGDEYMNEVPADGAGHCIPEPEAMEDALSEAMGSDLLTGKSADSYLEASNLQVDCMENALETDSQSHSVGTTDRILEERKSLSPWKEQESVGGADDNVEKSSFDFGGMKIVEIESCISLAGPNEGENGDFVLDKSLENYRKDENVVVSKLKCEKQEVITAELESKNQYLSEAIGSELCIRTAGNAITECDESNSKADVEKTALEMDDCNETSENTTANVEKRQSLSLPIRQEEGDHVENTLDKNNAEDGDPNASQLLECKTGKETNSRDEKAEFIISLERCEELNHYLEVEEVKNQKEEESMKQKVMEHFMTEAMSGEPHAAEIGDCEFELSKPTVELNNTIHCTDDGNQTVDVSNTTLKEKLSFSPVEEQEYGDLASDDVEKTCSEYGNDMQRDESKLNISLGQPVMVEDGEPILNKSLESYTEFEFTSRYTPAESSFSLERCYEKVNEEPEDGYLEGEEYDPEQEPMEMSLSETIHNELQAVISGRIQGVGDISFNVGELMEISNTPTKVPENPKCYNSLCETSVMGSLGAELENVASNSANVESDVNPSFSIENDDLHFDNSLSERSITDCEQLLSDVNRSFTEREINKGTDTTFDEQNKGKSDEVNAEVNSAVSMENVQSHEVNEETDILPFPVNTPVDVVHDPATLNSDCTSQLPLLEGDSIINSEANSGVVPSEDFGSGKEQSDNVSYAPEDSIESPLDEVPMACVTFSERDSVERGDDFMEPMDDVCVQETLESNKITSHADIQTDLHADSEAAIDAEETYEFQLPSVKVKIVWCNNQRYKLFQKLLNPFLNCPDAGYVKVEESGKFQLAHESSNEEEIWENTSFVTAGSFHSSMENVDVYVDDAEEDSKPVNFIEGWIREESSKESCVWAEYKILEHQFSFVVFNDAAVLTVNLSPLNEGQDSEGNRTVESVELKSCISDNYDRCLRVVMNVMLKRLPSSFLSLKCPCTEQLPSLFEFLNSEFLAMDHLLLQTYDLMRASPVRIKNDGFSFMVPSIKRMLLFEVQVNLLNWDKDGVKSEDVQVKNVIGKMGAAEIQSVFKSVKCDEHYFRNIYKDVLNFMSTLEMVLV